MQQHVRRMLWPKSVVVGFLALFVIPISDLDALVALEPQSAVSQPTRLMAYVESKNCDFRKSGFGYVCSVDQIEAFRRPVLEEVVDLERRFDALHKTNAELICMPTLGSRSINDSDSTYGPCLNDYQDEDSDLYKLLFPCSAPNSRLEQRLHSDYFSPYYRQVDRSKNYVGGCASGFPSDVGIGFGFLDVWKRRWSEIFVTAKSLNERHEVVSKQLQVIEGELNIARSIPSRNRGDCPFDQFDPTKGVLAKGKTIVDDKGFKFKCVNLAIRKVGRVPRTANALFCPESFLPQGSCVVGDSWGGTHDLLKLPQRKPKGRIVADGGFTSSRGYCTVRLYSNFAYQLKCS